MKRHKPLRRHAELKPDVEKVREFLKRGRENSTIGKGKRSGFRRASGREGPLTPAQWHQAVHDSSGGRCIMTGTRARDADDRRFEAHHPLSKRVLRDRGYFGRVWDPRNGVWLRRDVHEQQEHAFVRVPASKLPASVWEFCAELDELEGTHWATELVLRAHPN